MLGKSSGMKSEKYYGKIIRLGHFCGFTPFSWNGSNIQYSESSRRKIWQAVLKFGLILYQVFLCFQCWTILVSKEAGTRQKIGVLYATLVNILLSINHHVQIFCGQEYVRLMNGFRSFVSAQQFQGKAIRETGNFIRYIEVRKKALFNI